MLSMIMCTDIADPLQRLKQVQIETTLAKEYSQAVGAGTMLTLSESIPPLLMAVGIRAALQLQLMTDSSLPMNTTVTNVPGSRVPLYLCRAKLVRTAAFPPSRTEWAWCTPFSATRMVCRSVSPPAAKCYRTPPFYTECVNASFHELQDATKNVRRRNAGHRTHQDTGIVRCNSSREWTIYSYRLNGRACRNISVGSAYSTRPLRRAVRYGSGYCRPVREPLAFVTYLSP